MTSKRKDLFGMLGVCALFLLVRYILRVLGVGLGGPIATISALVAIVMVLRYEGRASLTTLGLGRPEHLGRALFMALLAFVMTVLAGVVLLPFLNELVSTVPSGRFSYMHGNIWALLASVVGIAWFAAAFGEEVFMRGFILPRLASVMGGSSRAWFGAVVIQALFFGVLHRGPANMIVTAVIGLGFGMILWLGQRNLWPLIVAHAIPDTISFVGAYQAG